MEVLFRHCFCIDLMEHEVGLFGKIVLLFKKYESDAKSYIPEEITTFSYNNGIQ